MKTKKFIPFVLVLLVILSGCSNNLTGKAILNDKAELTIGYLRIPNSLPYFVAKEKGYFEKYNLKINEQVMISSNMVLDAVNSGNLDATVEIANLPVFQTFEKDNSKVKIINFNLYRKNKHKFSQILVKKESNIQNINDLENKKIGRFPGSNALFFLNFYLKSKGLDTSTIDFIELVPPLQLGALESNQIDALMTYDPTITIALDTGKYRALSKSEVYTEVKSEFSGGCAIMSQQFIKENPITARKYYSAMAEAIEYINTNEEKARKILPKYLQISEDNAMKVTLPEFYTSEEFELDNCNEMIGLYKQAGFLETGFNCEEIIYKVK